MLQLAQSLGAGPWQAILWTLRTLTMRSAARWPMVGGVSMVDMLVKNCEAEDGPHPVDTAASSSLGMLVYSRVDDPKQTFSSASSTCRDKASGSVYTTTGVSPSSRHERATLRAISPRFAIRTLALPAEVTMTMHLCK